MLKGAHLAQMQLRRPFTGLLEDVAPCGNDHKGQAWCNQRFPPQRSCHLTSDPRPESHLHTNRQIWTDANGDRSQRMHTHVERQREED